MAKKRPWYLNKRGYIRNRYHKEIHAYCQAVYNELCMGGWILHVERELAKDKDASAAVNCGEWVHEARLRVGKLFFDTCETPASLRRTIVHEFVHMLMNDFILAQKDQMQFKNQGKRSHQSCEDAWLRAMEMCTDDIAQRLVYAVPLPEFSWLK